MTGQHPRLLHASTARSKDSSMLADIARNSAQIPS
jgi:hypothetical protein